MFFRRNVLILSIGVIAVVVGTVFFVKHRPYKQNSVNNPTQSQQKPVVVLLPHQDDEMFLAGAIKQYIDEGRTVYSIVATDGGSSRVLHTLNGKDETEKSVCCGLNGKIHNPIKEGYEEFTRQTFSTARNREYLESMRRLGLSESNILFANDGGVTGTSTPEYKDRIFTKEQATHIIQRVFDKVGDGTYITVESRLGRMHNRNPDHAALQDALIEFEDISEKFYFADIDSQSEKIQLSDNVLASKQYALHVYYEWDPGAGKFAIGAHSVKDLLDYWSNHPFEYRNQ